MRSASADARVGGDVPEFSTAEVLPELIAADLVHKVHVLEAVAVHISNGDARPVIVVNRLVVLPRIVHGSLHERDPAFFHEIFELELVVHLELTNRVALRLRAGGQRLHADILERIAHDRLA